MALPTSMLAALALAGGLAAQAPAVQDRTLRPQQAAPKAVAEPRVALLIGNSDYTDAPLKNPVNDARAMKGALEGCAFHVTLLENAGKQRMEEAIRAFGDQLQGGAVGLFYFAGHGVQVKGVNYLVPVGAALGREDEIAYQAVDVGQVLDKMESAKNPLNLVILDACRNNPFARSWRGVKGGGLAQVDAPAGTLIAYATAPGKTAADGGGAHGIYTEALLTELRQPGQKLLDVFQEVRRRVLAASDGAQIPWESNSTVGTFYFRPMEGGSPQGVSDPAALERAYWESIRDSREVEAFEAYLSRYPNGTFADLAKMRREALAKESASRDQGSALALAITHKGDCEECGLEEIIREVVLAKGWRVDTHAGLQAVATVEVERSTVGSQDAVMATWPVYRATVAFTFRGSQKTGPAKVIEVPAKGIASSLLRAKEALRKELRAALAQAIPDPAHLQL